MRVDFDIDKKFSKTIKADEDAYYMSCPEEISKYIAIKLVNFNSAVELCCAVGITSIQVAKKLNKVIGIDIDEKRIKNAKENAKMYGVEKKVKFIVGDVLDVNLIKKIKADVAIIDPDWSVEDIDKSIHVIDIDDTQPSIREIFNLTKKYITPNILIRVPKTFNVDTLSDLGQVRLEEIFWGDKLRFKLAFFF